MNRYQKRFNETATPESMERAEIWARNEGAKFRKWAMSYAASLTNDIEERMQIIKNLIGVYQAELMKKTGVI